MDQIKRTRIARKTTDWRVSEVKSLGSIEIGDQELDLQLVGIKKDITRLIEGWKLMTTVRR
jgi:hypothetical protein